MKASLVMRDRETDSWWSIMTSDAIAGSLEGAELDELPVGEKTTWGDWKSRHLETRVLSVNGLEHRDDNPYDDYFASAGTFRNLEIADRRLAPKEPVFSFWLEGQSYAIAHSALQGAALFELQEEPGRRILTYREPEAALFASTLGWLVEAADKPTSDPEALLARARAGDPTTSPLDGFDTFWYTWVSVNPESVLLAPR